ncbi:DUF2177 family protein [Bradyrhizobium sp.]|uniref:DUF2177 family protein n=1 Tax=Bradyrhizobium sp. TaxID=376 RepID=UPI000A53E781|nr:DUF2177 family protein [Bradyrhizobium sp.]
MLRYAIAYIATGAVFLGADYVWLSRTMGFYKNSIGHLLSEKPNLVAATAFYLIYVVGMVVFAVMPAARNDSWVSAVLLGGLLGLVAYATYDLTNLATLSRWPLIVTVVDLMWGTFVTALSALAGYIAVRTLAPIE